MNTLRESPTPRAPATCAGAVVLRDLGEDRAHRYATHWRNDDLGGYIWGHYFESLDEAEADYNARVKRGY